MCVRLHAQTGVRPFAWAVIVSVIHYVHKLIQGNRGYAITSCTEVTVNWTRDPRRVTCRRCLHTRAYRRGLP